MNKLLSAPTFDGGRLRTAVRTVAFALQFQNRRALDKPDVQDHCQRCVTEIVPVGVEIDEHLRRARPLTSSIDEFVPQVGQLEKNRELDAVEAEFMYDEPLRSCIDANGLVDGILVGARIRRGFFPVQHCLY